MMRSKNLSFQSSIDLCRGQVVHTFYLCYYSVMPCLPGTVEVNVELMSHPHDVLTRVGIASGN